MYSDAELEHLAKELFERIRVLEKEKEFHKKQVAGYRAKIKRAKDKLMAVRQLALPLE